MGACLSCLGARKEPDDAERQRLLYDDPYANQQHNYGSWSQSTVVPQNLMSAEEVRREQQALNDITRWASDQIVEIFPHRTNLSNLNLNSQTNLTQSTVLQPTSTNSTDKSNTTINGPGNGMTASAHQDILLSMIPGDKSKRSIRIYPASRPASRADGESIRSKSSTVKINGDESGSAIANGKAAEGRGKGVFVKLNVELP